MKLHPCGELSIRVRQLALRFPRLERAADLTQAALARMAG